MEATIKILVTKDDLGNLRKDIASNINGVKDNIANVKYELGNRIGDSIKWMFIFWIGQVGATLAIVFLFLKK